MNTMAIELKRKLCWSGEPSAKRQKNSVCALYELNRNIVFKVVDQCGPVHQPVFTVAVKVNGNEYQGQGKNKKSAKQAAAAVALRSIIQSENPSESEVVECISTTAIDFTNDVSVGAGFEKAVLDASSVSTPSAPHSLSTNGSAPSTMADVKNASKSSDKGPVMLLNELHPNAAYCIVSEVGEQYNKYTTSVMVADKRFEGTGASKKLSKAAAAKSALATLHNITYPPCFSFREHKSPVSQFDMPQVFADHVANLVTQKFSDLLAGDKDHTKRKVLAGIVMSVNMDRESCQVLAVATGTKCVKGEHMSVNGATVYDSHAEIISRRCFKRFLYSELNKHYSSNPKDSIFESRSFEDGPPLQLKPSFKLHLYISTAPCGDSRLFSPHDEDSEDKHPNRNSRGKLRTKIESGEGTIPVKGDEPIQTWDGIIQGERLLTMSCSDKIARWNVVGLQGSLLARFIQPIYLDSIILGSLFHPGHLHRAVIGRLQNFIQGLPCPYHINTPKMALISSKEVRNTGKAPSFSVNWTEGDKNYEVVNAMTGKTEDHQVSRLAKKSLFEHYTQLTQIIPSVKLNTSRNCTTYSEHKELSADYQVAKKEFYSALVRAGQGKWVKKPPETEQFEIPNNSSFADENNPFLSALVRAGDK